MYICDVDVLDHSGCKSTEATIYQYRLRWSGHVVRMDDTHLPKQLLYGELCEVKRPRHKPKYRYKDCIKITLKKCKINIDFWEEDVKDRSHWKQLLSRGIEQ